MQCVRRALLPALLLTGSAHAQDRIVDETPVSPSVTVKAKVDTTDRFTIPTHIDGKGPFPFLVDTGSQTTIISQQLADSLQLRPDSAMQIVSMSGRADVNTVAIDRLSYGYGDVQALRVPVVSAANLGAVGLLGLDSLKARKLVINNRTGTIQISESRSAPAGDAIVVEARSRFGQLILVDSTVEGRKVAVILDTGAQHSVGNVALFTSLWKREKLTRTLPVTLTSVLGQDIVGHFSIIDTMRVGKVNISNVGVVFTDATPFETLGLLDKPALLLGMDVLSGFNLIEVDFRRHRVNFYLPPRNFEPSPLPGSIRD